jgi:hypothetical protein
MLVTPYAVRAQAPESDPPPPFPQAEAKPASTPVDYVIPELPPWPQINKSWFTFKMGVGVLLDYTGFHQDAANIAQVGKQVDDLNVRDLRLLLRGTVGKEYKVGYFFAATYKGFDANPARNWDILDAYLIFPLGNKRTNLWVGKMKQTFSLEMVGDALTFLNRKRLMSPFFISRDLGVRVNYYTKNQRMTMSAGIYNGKLLRDNSASMRGRT